MHNLSFNFVMGPVRTEIISDWKFYILLCIIIYLSVKRPDRSADKRVYHNTLSLVFFFADFSVADNFSGQKYLVPKCYLYICPSVQ